MQLRELLKARSGEVRQVTTDVTIHTAIRIMSKHRIGSLMVVSPDGEIHGIVTERDCLHAVADDQINLKTEHILSIASTDLAVAELDDDLRYVLNVMREKNCRHVPVIEDGKLYGMISIRDVALGRLDEARTELKFLRNYINGPGA
ncbi:MAG: CBS domain-containing protein [Planctomycetota bacterium]|jgi:CBS domain-containing protein